MFSSYTFHPIYVLQLYNLALSLFIPLKLSLSRSPANNNSSLFLSGWGSIQRSVLDTIDHSLFWSTLLFQIPLHHNFLDFLLCHWLFLSVSFWSFIHCWTFRYWNGSGSLVCHGLYFFIDVGHQYFGEWLIFSCSFENLIYNSHCKVKIYVYFQNDSLLEFWFIHVLAAIYFCP